MSVLSEILQEEYNRLLSTISAFEKMEMDLPNGSVVKKRINGKEYYYRQWRDADKVKSEYIPQDKHDEISELVSRRKDIRRQLREMYASKKEFDRVIGKEL
ncbi:MAG: hypothetical protein LBQ21_01335 [Clostridiales Family XIII bacterium]|jgi:hypothetical protein|nr:hypothetical protein [Clostridiales Family XIII bacterium]